MAIDFIEHIYEAAYTISIVKNVIEEIRLQNDDRALRLLRKTLPRLEKFCTACLADHYEEAEALKENLLAMGEIQDIVLLGDILEGNAVPIMERWMQTMASVDLQLNEDYAIESTASGYLTLKHTGLDRYLHSNNDPMDEARKLVTKQFDERKSSYRVWGVGLGYHVWQLYNYSGGSVLIRLYEPNEDLLEYAKEYGVLAWIPKEVLEIVPCEDETSFLSNRREEEGVLYLAPYVRMWTRMTKRSLLMEDYIQFSSTWEGTHYLKTNFYRNLDRGLPDIRELDSSQMKEEMVIVAGGPSVDRVIDRLRQWQGNKTILAVGTIWRRLIREGIRPDYVVIMDPYESVYGQIKGVEDSGVPLLLNILAYWKVAMDYHGPIYTMCVGGPIPEVEAHSNQYGLTMWDSGGTVTALAMEVAIRHGAKKIYLAGADLAYPGGVTHAGGTDHRSQKDISELLPVPAVNGGTVYTDEAFTLYRKWIEYRISQTPEIRYFNLSEIGAKIAGTEPYVNI